MKKNVRRNPYGFSCRTTASGSMTRETILDWAIHFVKNLPKNQGNEKEPVLLFLDGHASRWDVCAIFYLLQNNVFPFFLASHTSVWAQPNDNGPNMRFHKSIETAVSDMGMRYSGIKTKHNYFNIIIRNAWKKIPQRRA